jgi:hypothetical protein
MTELKKRKKNTMVKIDMEMPKKCIDCPFVFYAKNCALTIRQVELSKKPDWCPLIEINEDEEQE